ncbi:DUF1127 domain-containing protein [Musicola keenii]|uniref:DUF1127 domain-containing protein n=1 Tax=Musicola keenii TaxID=2884250 RepID=UPI001CE2A430|nr:DUF1127 domain-containing protein [Musicola keenii]
MSILRRTRLIPPPRNWLSALYQAWLRHRTQSATRKLLWSMSDERLKDIGLTRGDIKRLYTSDYRDDTFRHR